MGTASPLDGVVEPRVFVIGDARDLDPYIPPSAHLQRGGPEDSDPEANPVGLVVLDARAHALSVLARARRSARWALVPALVVTDDPDDPALAAVGADDVLAPPFHRAGAGYRIRTLVELGRTRALLVQRQAFDHAILDGVDVGVATDGRGYVRTPDRKLEIERRRFERLAAMGTMVAGFAHEVRNPMASLRSIAESLNEELAEANVKLPHVDRMLKVLERVERLVRTSLLFGRPSPPRPAAHHPWTILSTAISSLSPRTQPLGSELCIEADPELPDVYVDDGQMVQALVILLNNALDATGSPRRVLLRARRGRLGPERRARNTDAPSGVFVQFDVIDDGPGIAPDIIGRVFDPFFTTKASGTGLGLSIAQQLVTENGARIEVASAVGGPTTFSVLVPVANGASGASSENGGLNGA